MITAIVRFKLPANVSLPAATELFKGSAPKYQNLPGLVRKYYLYGEGTGGGVYARCKKGHEPTKTRQKIAARMQRKSGHVRNLISGRHCSSLAKRII